MTRLLCWDITGADDRLLYRMATPARRRRANQCRSRDRARSLLAAEALLRYGLPEADLTALTVGPWGKPVLPGCYFNLSHSGRWVVLAVSGTPVGVDVEAPKAGRDYEKLCRRYFTPEEQTYVGNREDRFLEVWTGKESYLKYLGRGLTQPLNTVNTFALPLHSYYLGDGSVVTLCGTEAPGKPELLTDIF